MAQKIINTKIQEAYDTEANWIKYNPVLLAGQLAFSKDKYGKYKIGDGIAKWSQLQYMTLGWNDITGKPSSFTPSSHTHDDRYFTETEATNKFSPKEGSASLSKLASTITLGAGDAATILQNGSTYQQKIEIIDNSTSGDAVFGFYQSGDSGKNFNKLMTINDDGNVVANKFTGALAGNASSASSVPWSGVSGKPSTFPPSTHKHPASQITGLPTKLPNPQLLTFTGAANTKYDGSGAITVHIPTTSATPSSLAIQLNGGTTEGTNKFTFNGSAAKTVNITPSEIGAAAASHTHNSIKDSGNASDITFAYSRDGLSGSETKWLAAWRGYELRAISTASVLSAIKAAPASHTHNYAGSSSAGGAANSAVKLASARTIKVGGYVDGTTVPFDGTKNIEIPITYIPEARLSWGGTNRAGSVSVIDAAASQLHSANRFAFSNPAGITVEYSRDGSTWTPYSVSDSVKVGLVSGKSNYLYIGGTSSGTTIKYKLRITLDAQRMGVYTALKKVLINVSTNGAGGAKCLIERSNVGSKTNFLTFGTFEVAGWSGWNSIPIVLNFGGGSNQTSNTGCLRFTFSISSLSSSHSNAFSVSDIIALGDTYWNYPSEMSKSGHLYSYDSSQNAVFPANITAKSFIGSLQGTATNATTASKLGTTTNGSSIQPIYLNNGVPVACTYTLGKSVPSNAVFTDTWRPIQDNLTSTSTTDSLSANQGRILKGLIDSKAPSSHSHTIANITNLQSALDGKASTSHTHEFYATTKHTHNTINDLMSGNPIGISTSTYITPATAGDYDIVVANTSKIGNNKCVVMSKVSFVEHAKNHIIETFPLKAITNSQIDSLASL